MKEPDLISDMKEMNISSAQTGQENKLNNNKSQNSISISKNDSSSRLLDLGQIKLNHRVSVLKCNNQIKELHTVLRDRYCIFRFCIFLDLFFIFYLFFYFRETSHSDFKFYSDRLVSFFLNILNKKATKNP